MLNQTKHVAFTAVTLFAIISCSAGGKSGSADTGQSSSEATILADSAKNIALHLNKFDTLDFDVFSNQKWDRLKESHAADITVSWPDGHDTHGIEKHIEDLKAMFVPMPDLSIKEHPIKIANGHWTAVVGHMMGTFTKPMPIGGGKTIAPTGKKVDMMMTTIGHWTDAGVMDHEWLFWDNQTYMKQLGLSK